MSYIVLNPEYESTDPVEIYDSLIWTERYWEAGDFEIYVPASVDAHNMYLEDYYLWSSDSDRLMIIEDVQDDTDAEDGSFTTITGRSLESILERRIIWNQTILTGNFQNGIKQLLDQNAISPSDASRKIPGLRFVASLDPKVTSLTIDAQYMGENLYDAIVKLCKEKKVGFKIIMPTDGDLIFTLYAGLDRTYDQLANPQVIFSPNFDNLAESTFRQSMRPHKTVVVVGGEGEGTAKKRTTVARPEGAGTGMSRREMYSEASGVSSNNGAIPDATYYQQLTQKGLEILAANARISTFDGKIENLPSLRYSEHYYLGDIVQVENEFGAQGKSRITEFIRSHSKTAIEAYPTLESADN